jgi:D-aminopeptidase
MGGTGNNSSGDLFLAFATGNRGLAPAHSAVGSARGIDIRMIPDGRMTPLFQAAVEATEAAIVNALLAAETMTGRDGVTAHALPVERLVEVMARYGRGPAAA